MNGRVCDLRKGMQGLIILMAAMLLPVFLFGCVAAGKHGNLERSRDLDNLFLKYEVLPDHMYYTSGGYDKPEAIIAIHKDYQLDNSAKLWVNYPNVDYAQMRKWIDTIGSEQNLSSSGSYFAAYILDPDGKRIGAWYSNEVYTSVKFPEENRIVVYPPVADASREINREIMDGGFLQGIK